MEEDVREEEAEVSEADDRIKRAMAQMPDHQAVQCFKNEVGRLAARRAAARKNRLRGRFSVAEESEVRRIFERGERREVFMRVQAIQRGQLHPAYTELQRAYRDLPPIGRRP